MWNLLAPGVYQGVPGSPGGPGRASDLLMLAGLSGIPLATRAEKRFSTWQARRDLGPAFKAAHALAQGQAGHPFLTLVGPVGVGKTHLALAIGWEYLDRGMTVAYWQVEGFLDALRRGYVMFQRGHLPEAGTPEPYRTLNFAMRCALLILDDMGAHKETEWATAKLDEVVDHRYINRHVTVVTSNDLGQVPERVVDRLREGQVVRLRGESYRGLRQRGITAEKEG